MQVNAISNSFTGFGNKKDEIASLDDRALRTVAYAQTSAKYDQKKARRVNNAMFYSVPVVAGLAATVLHKGKRINLFGKYIKGHAANVAQGMKSFGLWAAGLLAADVAIGFSKILSNKSEKADKFSEKHPFLSFLAVMGASVGLFALGAKGISMLAKNEKVTKKLSEWTVAAAKKINNTKFLDKVSEKFGKVVARAPKSVKSVGKFALNWAPELMVGATLGQSLGFAAARSNDYRNNYRNLKDEQLGIVKERNAELKLQNDFLRTFEDNQDRLANTPKPVGDMEV